MRTISEKLQGYLIIALLAIAWILAAINPFDRGDWLLENLLVFLFFAVVYLTKNTFRFSLSSYWLFAIFMCLHLYGSHYTYSQTPLGFWFQEQFGLSRNHYDRAVHFCFGLLLAYPFMELTARKTGLRGISLKLFTLCIVISCSTLYELVEMIAATIVNPELGSAFLGTQGDEWDAQKDTGLAMLGALLAVIKIKASANKPVWLESAT